MEAKLWDHQAQIVERGREQRCFIIAADMGTGKSLAFIALTETDFLIVIICPVAVGPAWEKQFRLWDSSREVYSAYAGTSKKRMQAVTEALKPSSTRRVLITNYDWFWRKDPYQLLHKAAKVYNNQITFCMDECHKLKSPAGKASRHMYQLSKAAPQSRRIGMSGTIMPHSPADIYAQARAIDSSFFGTSKVSFMSRFFITDQIFPSKIIGRRDEAEFEKRLAALAYRVRADDVLDLPPALHQTLDVELPATAMKVYRGIEKHLSVEIQDGTVNTTNALTKLIRLRQVCSSYCGTDVGVRRLEEIPSKIKAIEELVSDLAADEPVAIFYTFQEESNAIREMAKRLGREYAELSGKEKTLSEWQAGEKNLIGVQLQAGGVGVDLTRSGDKPCRYVVYMSVSFSLGDYEQSLARVRRPGQTAKCVRYYHAIAKGTIDHAVYAALQSKKGVIENVLRSLLPGAKTE